MCFSVCYQRSAKAIHLQWHVPSLSLIALKDHMRFAIREDVVLHRWCKQLQQQCGVAQHQAALAAC